MNSRTDYAIKNVKWGYICTGITYLFGFVLRTLIIRILGENYAGINGLFSNILGVLSFAELGIGTALNYSLYKPIAVGDNEKVKSLMQLYKVSYRLIASIIAFFGTCLIPFLDKLVKDPGDVGDLKVYYIIYLFTTVTTYFVSYKYSLANAKQENYLVSFLTMISSCFTYIMQIVVLLLFKDYLIYLVVGVIVDCIQKIWISSYINSKYHILKEKSIVPLEKKEKREIFDNTKALILHKVGDVSVHQTDNIIISAFVNVSMVGKVTYYSFFINAAHQLFVVALNAVVGSLGNAISEENQEIQYKLFKVYRFVAFWMYGLTSIGLYIMLSKLVYILVGSKMVIANLIVLLMIIDFYMIGQRAALNNMKMAGGIFRQDQFIPIVQAVVNLIVSIVLVKHIGVIGVYIGTVVQGLVSTIIRPCIVYPQMFNKNASFYFVDSMKYIFAMIVAFVICKVIDVGLFTECTLFTFVVEMMLLVIVINSTFLILFAKNIEMRYLIDVIKEKFKWKKYQ